jgi:hypothetical protein
MAIEYPGKPGVKGGKLRIAFGKLRIAFGKLGIALAKLLTQPDNILMIWTKKTLVQHSRDISYGTVRVCFYSVDDPAK